MAPKASERGPPPRKFWVQATKKGLAPLTVEKRKFKKVTVLKNCGGDVRELLQTVKQILGVGGSVQESGGNVLGLEFQGDQTERLSKLLDELNLVVGRRKEPAKVEKKEDGTAKTRKKPKKTQEVYARKGYDDLLKETNAKKKQVAYDHPGAEATCWQWHGWWPYCRGNCVKEDDDDLFFCLAADEEPIARNDAKQKSSSSSASSGQQQAAAQPSSSSSTRANGEVAWSKEDRQQMRYVFDHRTFEYRPIGGEFFTPKDAVPWDSARGQEILDELGFVAKPSEATREWQFKNAHLARKRQRAALLDAIRDRLPPGARGKVGQKQHGNDADEEVEEDPVGGPSSKKRKAAAAKRPALAADDFTDVIEPEQELECPVCGNIFSLAKTLKTHIKRAHPFYSGTTDYKNMVRGGALKGPSKKGPAKGGGKGQKAAAGARQGPPGSPDDIRSDDAEITTWKPDMTRWDPYGAYSDNNNNSGTNYYDYDELEEDADMGDADDNASTSSLDAEQRQYLYSSQKNRADFAQIQQSARTQRRERTTNQRKEQLLPKDESESGLNRNPHHRRVPTTSRTGSAGSRADSSRAADLMRKIFVSDRDNNVFVDAWGEPIDTTDPAMQNAVAVALAESHDEERKAYEQQRRHSRETRELQAALDRSKEEYDSGSPHHKPNYREQAEAGSIGSRTRVPVVGGSSSSSSSRVAPATRARINVDPAKLDAFLGPETDAETLALVIELLEQEEAAAERELAEFEVQERERASRLAGINRDITLHPEEGEGRASSAASRKSSACEEDRRAAKKAPPFTVGRAKKWCLSDDSLSADTPLSQRVPIENLHGKVGKAVDMGRGETIHGTRLSSVGAADCEAEATGSELYVSDDTPASDACSPGKAAPDDLWGDLSSDDDGENADFFQHAIELFQKDPAAGKWVLELGPARWRKMQSERAAKRSSSSSGAAAVMPDGQQPDGLDDGDADFWAAMEAQYKEREMIPSGGADEPRPIVASSSSSTAQPPSAPPGAQRRSGKEPAQDVVCACCGLTMLSSELADHEAAVKLARELEEADFAEAQERQQRDALNDHSASGGPGEVLVAYQKTDLENFEANEKKSAEKMGRCSCCNALMPLKDIPAHEAEMRDLLEKLSRTGP